MLLEIAHREQEVIEVVGGWSLDLKPWHIAVPMAARLAAVF